jgi:hypothetical protein
MGICRQVRLDNPAAAGEMINVVVASTPNGCIPTRPRSSTQNLNSNGLAPALEYSRSAASASSVAVAAAPACSNTLSSAVCAAAADPATSAVDLPALRGKVQHLVEALNDSAARPRRCAQPASRPALAHCTPAVASPLESCTRLNAGGCKRSLMQRRRPAGTGALGWWAGRSFWARTPPPGWAGTTAG